MLGAETTRSAAESAVHTRLHQPKGLINRWW